MSPLATTLTVSALVVGGLCVALVPSRPIARWSERQYRHAATLRVLVVATGAVMALFAVICLCEGSSDGLFHSLTAVAAVLLLLIGLMLPGLQRRPAVPLRHRRILAIGAHPDDLELACGATLAKLIDDGHEVMSLVLSDGASGGNAAKRVREAEVAGEYLGMIPTVYTYCDTQLDTQERELVAVIERHIAQFAPDVIVTHSANDYHQDHVAVHRATMRAARKQPTILCFESPSTTPEFSPRFFVDVRGYLNIKVNAITLHHDQLGKPYMGGDRARSTAVFRGGQGRLEFAEGFEVVRMQAESVGGV